MPRIERTPGSTPSLGLSVGLVTKTAIDASSPADAARALEQLADKPDVFAGFAQAPEALQAPVKAAPLAPGELADRAEVLERRLESTLRALRKEASGRASPAAVRVLGQDAMRLLIEVMGTRRLEQLVASGAGQGPASIALRSSSSGADVAPLLQGALSSTRPDRHRAIAALLLASKDAAASTKADAKGGALTDAERRALADILSSLDPSHGSLVREKLAAGASLDDVRHLLSERLVPVTLDAPKEAAEVGDGAKPVGLKFDLGINKWVQNDRSWRYEVRLAQIFEYVVDGIIDGKEELKARLLSSSIDPATGENAVDEKTVSKFVDDLAVALHSDDPAVRKLLDQRFEMIFSTTDGGDKPVAALWELPVRVTADLFAAMTDASASDKLGSIADTARAADEKRRDDVKKPLAKLLEKYPGVPRRHKRAHAALINMGLAGQSVAEMGKDDGVLPRSKTLLDPQILKEKYADASDLKMRFLLTDELEMFVLTDADFEAVVKKWGFPPNHELLSYNRPIAGSGYVKVDHGKITALEDDVVMLKGKLPDGLPPAIEILRARGFELDEKSIEKSSHVLDFEAFQKLVNAPDLPKAPTGTPSDVAKTLKESAHADRPALAAAVVKQAYADALAQTKDDAKARAQASAFVSEALAGLHIINTSRKDFREGRLPRHLNESSDLLVDASLAEHLVRLVKADGGAP